MPIFGGKESETALAEPFEAPALAAFPQFAHVNFGPGSLIGAVFLTPTKGNKDDRGRAISRTAEVDLVPRSQPRWMAGRLDELAS